MSLVALKDITLTLGHGAARTEILKGVDFTVEEGESVAILGPSGSGKSSLMALVAGLERPTSGSVSLFGQDIGAMSEDALARLRGRDIGIVLQNFQLLPTMTALENVAVPLELAGEEGAFDHATTELGRVGLGDRLTHYPTELSGGEQQRVAIARATAPGPRLLLADEPTGNLDAVTGGTVADILFERAEERGAGLLLITHDPALAERAGRIVRMDSGKLSS